MMPDIDDLQMSYSNPLITYCEFREFIKSALNNSGGKIVDTV